jgi:hypothetical protein
LDLGQRRFPRLICGLWSSIRAEKVGFCELRTWLRAVSLLWSTHTQDTVHRSLVTGRRQIPYVTLLDSGWWTEVNSNTHSVQQVWVQYLLPWARCPGGPKPASGQSFSLASLVGKKRAQMSPRSEKTSPAPEQR